MDIATRKYNFIQEVFSIENETFEKLEKILKKEKAGKANIPLEHKIELGKRLDAYKKDPDNVLSWSDVKEKW
jgi:Putative addiction module component